MGLKKICIAYCSTADFSKDPVESQDRAIREIKSPAHPRIAVTGTKVTKYVAILREQTRSQKQTLLCDDDHETD